jgi:putative endonuclease
MNNKKTPKEPTEKQKIGRIGEDCACKFLVKEGYRVIDRNYLKKWGEIDIVATKAKRIHFVEVKSVSREIKEVQEGSVIHETQDGYRPEDNMHPWKLQRLGRVIQSYLLDKNISNEIEWQFDVVTVYIDMSKRMSKVFIMEDIVL